MSNLKKTGRTGFMPGVVLRFKSAVLLVAALFFVVSGAVYTYTRGGVGERAYAATSSNLNFQARVLNASGSTVSDGLYNVQFKLYTTATDGTGTNLWTESYIDANGAAAGQDNRVRVVNGYFSVNLGSLNAFPSTIDWSEEMWLTMNIGGTAQTATPTYDGEMLTPTNLRTKLTAVPYAFRAASAASADTLQKNSGGFTGTVDFSTLTADRRYLFPDTSLATTASPGIICVYNGAASNCPAAAGSAYYIQNDTVLQTQSNYNIQARDSGVNGTIGAQIRAAAGGQTVDLFQIQNSTGAAMFAVNSTGATTTTGLTVNNNGDFTQTGTGAFSTGTGLVSLNGNTTVTGTLDVTGASSITSLTATGAVLLTATGTALSVTNDASFGGTVTTNSLAVVANATIGGTFDVTGVSTFSGDVTLDTNANFSQTGTGTFSTGTGDVSLNGNTSVTGTATFNVGTGLTTLAGGATITGTTQINVGGTANTSIGNTTGSVTVTAASLQLNTGLVQRTATGTTTLDLNDAADTTLALLNSGTGVANLVVDGAGTFAGLLSANGGLTVEAGDTFTFNGDAFTDLTGTGLAISGGALSIDPTYTAGFFQNGGNSFGATAVLGTNDTNILNLRTDGQTRISISAAGATTLTGSLEVDGATNLDGNTEVRGGATFTVGSGLTTLNGGATITGTTQINTTGTANTSIGNTTGSVTVTAANLQLGTSLVQRTASGTTSLDLNDIANTTLALLNSGTGVANLTVDGTITTVALSVTTTSTFTGLATFNGGLTVEAGDTLTFNGDAFTDLTGSGLIISSGALTVDNTSATGFFRNGGNTFTANATIGNNGNFSLGFRTNNQTQLTLTNTGNLEFSVGSNRTLTVAGQMINVAGNNLTVAAGAAGAGAAAFSGGTLTLQGGAAAGTGNANGGAVTISGGAGTGTGTQGLVNLSTTAFTSAAVQTFATPGTFAITQSNIDNYSTVPITATATNVFVTVPDPSQAVIGRLVYIAVRNGSLDFTLRLNPASATPIDIAMKANSTATLVWNGDEWTAAGASSSTDLQSAYNNTLTSAGGAEIILNPTGGNADGFTIRNNGTTPISGGLLEVQSSIGTNLFSVNNFGTELAANGGAETTTTFATDWSTYTGSTVTQTSTVGQFATGRFGVAAATTTTQFGGVRNNLVGNPVASTTYQVSFTAKSSLASTPIDVQYSPDGGTTLVPCAAYSTQTLNNANWTKLTCTLTTGATAVTNPDLIIRKTDTSAPTIYVDNLSFQRNDMTTQPSNVQIGGGVNGGPVTLFTLDRSTAPPVAAGNTTYLGSMYYDITTGRIQCYEADGWGACGSAPDNIITLTPEYTGAVLNGTGVGTLTADFCANQTSILVVGTLCATGNSRQFYKWTSPQATQQTYGIYVSYKLPNTFKSFNDNNTITLTALSTNTASAAVTYEVFRSTGSAITRCGTGETSVTSVANTWQTVPINGNELSCGFIGGDNVIFKINVKANSGASAYVENLNFIYLNN